jgi:hypothetical protein
MRRCPATSRRSTECLHELSKPASPEFVKALMRVGGLQDPGWDPYESTLRTIHDHRALHEQLPEGGEHLKQRGSFIQRAEQVFLLASKALS